MPSPSCLSFSKTLNGTRIYTKTSELSYWQCHVNQDITSYQLFSKYWIKFSSQYVFFSSPKYRYDDILKFKSRIFKILIGYREVSRSSNVSITSWNSNKLLGYFFFLFCFLVKEGNFFAIFTLGRSNWCETSRKAVGKKCSDACVCPCVHGENFLIKLYGKFGKWRIWRHFGIFYYFFNE